MDPPWKLHATTSNDERERLVEAIRAKRDEALERRRELLIHREALGIRRNDVLETLYPTGDVPTR